ncbi:phosphatidylinositol glycan anchor biosynthesis class U protein-like [Halichondria panicea]|uniref:phosphatidylinositol glycan anchor biosynthesis class U protein-like n=1 Tax=Halichondria panicea TaxID=6063 RepID=UPI00312B57AC
MELRCRRLSERIEIKIYSVDLLHCKAEDVLSPVDHPDVKCFEGVWSLLVCRYLLNPYSIVTCAGFSTITLTNLSVTAALSTKLRGHEVVSSLCLCVAAYLSLYPAVLIFPFMIMSYRDGCVFGAGKQLCLVVCWSAVLLGGSALLSVPDQTPNLGLFWYFFTETFEHFRIFFLCVFQMNAFIYVIPLTIRFSDHPVFLTYILLSVTTLFKSYPCLGDLTIPLALLPLWTHTFRYLRYTLVVVVMFLASSLLCPVLWHLWIHAGSANANFFFAMTLTYSLAQIFLVADVIYSFLVHQYDLKHGLPRLDQLGKPVKLKLY